MFAFRVNTGDNIVDFRVGYPWEWEDFGWSKKENSVLVSYEYGEDVKEYDDDVYLLQIEKDDFTSDEDRRDALEIMKKILAVHLFLAWEKTMPMTCDKPSKLTKAFRDRVLNCNLGAKLLYEKYDDPPYNCVFVTKDGKVIIN